MPFFFDDFPAILENPTIHNLWNLAAVFSPPGGGYPVQGRPIVNLSLAINYALGGHAVFGYHLFNLVLHAAVALLVVGVVRRTLLLPVFSERWGAVATDYAAAVALLWAVHPLTTEAVTYVIQRTELLCSLFYLLTLYCCIRGFAATDGRRWFAAAVAACLIGMGCKETMATAPVMVALYDRVFVARAWKEMFRRRWGLYGGLAATWILLAVLVATGAGRGGTAGFAAGIAWWDYARTQLWAIARYLRLAVWPVGLVVDYGTWIARAPSEVLPGAVVVAALLAATAAAYWKWPWAGYLGTWFFVVLAPTSLVPVATQTVAEKRMYLPLAAVVTFFVFAGSAAGRRILARLFTDFSAPQSRRLAINWGRGVVIGLAVILGTLTALRNRDYRSEFAIWDDTIRKWPHSWRAYTNRAIGYGAQGEYDLAIADCNRAIEMMPARAEPYNNRAAAYAAKGNAGQALADYARALEINPRSGHAYAERGSLYSQLGEHARAVEDFTRAIPLLYEPSIPLKGRAEAWCALGEYMRAIEDCTRALALNPRMAEAYAIRANAWLALGDHARAMADYTRAIEIEPDMVTAWNNRGAMFLQAGEYARAIADFTEALSRMPNYAEALTNRATAYYHAKEYEKARADLKALEALGKSPPPKLAEWLASSAAAPPKP
ncbi:MAG: tetratricopeptide repeat protein [Candidatus Sumerlaeia bacterium]|nr:tetratricopeptide repeat protein [Candidatus Sumerlaeia bacterium]